MAVKVDSTNFLSLMLSTYRFEMAVSAFDNLRCCMDEMPCAKRMVVNMLKMKRMENFFMIQCKCYNFANFLAFKDRFLETDCKDTFFCSLSLCCLYIINRNNVEFNAFFCVQRQVLISVFQHLNLQFCRLLLLRYGGICR